MSDKKVNIALTKEEAIVLFDFSGDLTRMGN
jgi:hypothetical protein